MRQEKAWLFLYLERTSYPNACFRPIDGVVVRYDAAIKAPFDANAASKCNDDY